MITVITIALILLSSVGWWIDCIVFYAVSAISQPYNGAPSLTKKNYSKLYTSKLWYYGTLIYYGKQWYFGQNYGTIPRTMELRFMKEKTW